MNFESVGHPILKIYKKGDEKSKKPKGGQEVYISSDMSKCRHPYTNIDLKQDEIIKLIPIHTRERNVLYITGMSGSGKSYFLNEYLKEYKKIFKKRNIYLFSSLSEDKTLDSNKDIKRVKLDQKFLTTEFTLADFTDSVIILDDCDVITNKALKTKLFNILQNLLQTGRHTSTDVIFTSHVACKGPDTKVILAECTHMCVFPKTSGARTLNYLLGNYIGLDKKQIETIKKLKTRSVCIVKTYPNVILHDQGAYILHGDNF